MLRDNVMGMINTIAGHRILLGLSRVVGSCRFVNYIFIYKIEGLMTYEEAEEKALRALDLDIINIDQIEDYIRFLMSKGKE